MSSSYASKFYGVEVDAEGQVIERPTVDAGERDDAPHR